MIIMVFWFMLDVNNIGPVTYYSFKSDRKAHTKKSVLQSH